MKKIKLLLAFCALLIGWSNASADVTLETDLTSQFSSLTNVASWTGATGYTGTGFCPMVDVSGGIGKKQVCESYKPGHDGDPGPGCTVTGDVFYATVTGLAAGTYTIELYGGAAFTFGRGFGSDAFTGEHNTGGTWGSHTSTTYTAGQHIDTNTGVELYAQSEGVKYGGEIPIYYATNFPDGAATVTIENVVVGASGQIKIGMSKTSMSTNWHVIQLKSVIATVSGDAAIASLKATANALLNNATYVNVTGSERTNLQAAYDATPAAETQEAYEAVISALNSAISAFENCDYAAYDKFVAEKTKAAALGMDVSGYTATDAADASTKTQTIMVSEYTYVTTNYSYSVSLGTWTKTGETDENKGQHWDGTSTSTYLEQKNTQSPAAGWYASSWEIGYDQDIALPAGDYVFKVAGRKSSNDVTLTLKVRKGENELGSVNDFPNGDTGKGINTSAATDFATGVGHTYANDNNGRGWQWRYVKFTLAEAATVNIAITAEANSLHQWMGFCNPTVQTNNGATQKLIAYNIALSDAEKEIADDAYDNVTGSEKTALQDAIDADASLDKSDEDAIVTATSTLNSTRVAFTGAKSAYDALATAKATSKLTKITDVGTKAFQYNETTNNELYAAYEDAKNAVDADVTSSYTAASAQALVDAFNTATNNYNNQTQNAPGENDEFVLTNTAADVSLTVTGESVTVNNGSVYFTAVDGGYVISNSNHEYIFKTTGNNWTLSTTETKGDAYVVTVKFEGDGAYSIHGAKGYFGTDATAAGSAVYANKGVNDNGKWRISLKTASVNVSEAGWATLYTSYALDFSGVEGLKAYTATVDESTVTLTQVNDVPANTGVVLKGAENTYTIPVIASSETAKGSLRGSATETTNADAAPTGKAYYILTKDGDKAKFSPATGIIAAGKAYLEYDWSAGGGVKALNVVVDGTITGVEAPVAAEAEEEGVLYNTAGQVVTKDYKGIIIKNGKKYLNK